VVVLSADDPDSVDAHTLIAELGQALTHITGSSGAASFDPDEVRGTRAAFLIARTIDGALLGCAALRPLDFDVAEVKRMYARPGSGSGTQLLGELERRALALGYREIRLETRRVNARAVAFYAKHGYRPIPNYGKYVGRPDAICMGKTLRG
jgi:GNAT superfamily N-acetyltransferase